MKLTNSVMKQILKEEYEKRIVHFLKENIPVEDSRGVNVLQGAKDLKVREKKSGDEYIFNSIVSNKGEDCAKLYVPGDAFRDTAYSRGAETSLVESEYDEVGFVSRVGEKGREISPVDDNFDQLKLLDREDEEIGKEEQSVKLPPRKYILIPMTQFKERFEIQ